MLIVACLWFAGVVLFDLGWRRVPNTWALGGAMLAIAALLTGYQLFNLTWQSALTGAVGAFVALLCGYAVGLMGAGDVKFAGVLGLWLGWLPSLPIAIGAGVLVGLHAVLWLVLQRLPTSPRWTSSGLGRVLDQARHDVTARQIPYAGYLSITALAWIALRVSGIPA